MKPRRKYPPPPDGAGYEFLGVIEGENELFRDRPMPPLIGRYVGDVFIPPDADREEVIRLLEQAAPPPPAGPTPPAT